MVPKRTPKRKRKRKPKRSTLQVHTDGRASDDAKIAEVLAAPAKAAPAKPVDTEQPPPEAAAAKPPVAAVIQAAVHYVDSTFVAGVKKQAPPTDKPYRILENPEQYGMRRVHVPAGAVVLWGGWTAHANENPLCVDPDLRDCEYDVTVGSVEELKAMLALRGVAVWPGVVGEAKRAEMIKEMVDDLRRAAPDGTVDTELYPPGGIGCMITKGYGLGNTIGAQQRRLFYPLRRIFAGMYGIDPFELTQSADAFSWVPPQTPGGQPLRCAQFVSWAPWAAMDPKEVPKKIRAFKAGKSMCHDPLRFRSGGGPGHMANPKEGKPGHWHTLHDAITPAQLQALGAR